MQQKLIQDWEFAREFGYETQMKNKDGLLGWVQLAECFGHEKHIFDIKTDLFWLVQYYVSDDDTVHKNASVATHNMEVKNVGIEHFFIQHFKLPMMNEFKLSYCKLMQIAYNSGRFLACEQKKLYHDRVSEFYHTHKMMELQTFVCL